MLINVLDANHTFRHPCCLCQVCDGRSFKVECAVAGVNMSMARHRTSGPTGVRKAFRWRIVIVLLTAALLPLIISGFGSWIVFRSMLEQKSFELMINVVEGHAEAIESHLSEQLHLLELAARSRPLDEIVSSGKLQNLMNDLNQSSSGGFIDLGIIDAGGDHVAYVGPYDLRGRNYREAEWFEEVMAAGAYISDVFLGFRQVPHCIIAVKARTDDEQWILRATINGDQFDKLVESEILGEGSYAYIVNRDGLYQTSPKAGSLLEKAPGLTVSYHSGVLQHRVNVGGIDKIRATTWINDGRWMLGVEQNLETIQAPVDRAIATGAQVVGVAVLLLILTTFLATRHLTDRIDKASAERDEMSRAFLRSAKLASIGELATGLAHEINNPLAIMSAEQTNVSDLVQESEGSPQWRNQVLESVNRCKEQVRRCAGITQKMLQFGRKRDSDLEPTDIAPRFLDIIDLLKRRAAVRNVQIDTEIEDGLPQVLADPIELEQVLVNLINNAIDAMPEGGTVTVRAFRDDDAVHLEVSDNGTGIPPQELDRIFEPFYTTKPAGKGTGLGLSVCYGIISSWGGRISAESRLGDGTTVHIFLPYRTANGSRRTRG